MEQEYFYELMYGWIAERNPDTEAEHASGFDFARFVHDLINTSH